MNALLGYPVYTEATSEAVTPVGLAVRVEVEEMTLERSRVPVPEDLCWVIVALEDVEDGLRAPCLPERLLAGNGKERDEKRTYAQMRSLLERLPVSGMENTILV